MNDAATIDNFLAQCLRAVRAQEAAPWTQDASTAWKTIWGRIEYHGIAFLLNSNALHLSNWPARLLERITEEARLVALWETTHHHALGKVLGGLNNAGIDATLMKGTALAYSLHNEPATRRRGDTDLLVRPKDRDGTRAMLQQLGWYRKEDPHGLYYQEGWLHDAAGFFVHSIDLHWEPSDRPVLQTILPLEEFFSDRRSVPRLHQAAFRPHPALMVLHATINQKWHALHGYHSESGRLMSPRRLIWSVDLDLLCQSMTKQDWRKLEEHCEASGIGALVAEALRGMQIDLENSVPEASIAALEARPLDPTVAAYFANPDSLNQFWIDLKKARSFSQKASLVRTRAFPPREHLLEKYPSAAKWPTALLQGRLLLDTAGRAVRKVGSR
ncbi:MAG: nucleotidyltransferase family protein [Erythrobacter sp.]|uniref:nucleotidyltransferase family protein n=1 Tax=Erythrobacter sp. TaxID=1042 RepID=UPI00329988D8